MALIDIVFPKDAVRITARDFNRDVSAAKRAAEDGPVLITNRGAPTHVLLAYGQVRPVEQRTKTIYEMLHADWIPPELNDFDWEIERDRSTGREVDFD
jgi:hypothetical protein